MNASSIAVAALATSLACAWAAPASAAPVEIPMNLVNADGVGAPIGTISAVDTAGGLQLTPSLSGLPPGQHGFHVHDKPSCEPGPDPDKGGTAAAAFAAGGHFDPGRTGKHEGPKGPGHKGDLPYLTVGADGEANEPMVAPRLKAADLSGHALMIHAGGDDYSDRPTKLGGGGGRIACGVVK